MNRKHAEAVLSHLDDFIWLPGHVLRSYLNHGKWFWQRWSGPGFYALMARMEDEGLVERRVYEKQVGGASVQEHQFRRAVWQ